MEWQPIETAPKDGTKIDVAVKVTHSAQWNKANETTVYERQTDAFWSDGAWVYEDYGNGGDLYDREIEESGWFGSSKVTHWMPLPTPPVT